MAKKTERFEEHLEVLERIVDELESGELSLDDSLKRFEEGVKRLKSCRGLLAKAEERVKVLLGDAEVEPEEEPFEGGEA